MVSVESDQRRSRQGALLGDDYRARLEQKIRVAGLSDLGHGREGAGGRHAWPSGSGLGDWVPSLMCHVWKCVEPSPCVLML